MSTDYSKLKNAELEALLKERGLPHTGKKADMVARLQEDDTKKSAPAQDAPASNKEDEIDWDDDTGASTEPAAAAVAAGGKGQVANPAAVPNQVVDENPATTNDLSATVPPHDAVAGDAAAAEEKNEETEKPAVDFKMGLAEITNDDELTKRKKRAERFGTTATAAEGEGDDKPDPVDEAAKLAKRASRFGTGDEAPRGLNEALPDKSLKRGREARDEGRRGDFKSRRGQGQFRGGRRGPRSRPTDGGWMTDKDREVAAKRKTRWASRAAS